MGLVDANCSISALVVCSVVNALAIASTSTSFMLTDWFAVCDCDSDKLAQVGSRMLTEVYAPIATWAKMHGQPPEIFVVERA